LYARGVTPPPCRALLLGLILAVAGGACTTREGGGENATRLDGDRASLAMSAPRAQQRIAIRTARLQLEVEHVARAAEAAARIAAEAGGYVETTEATGEESGSLTLRVAVAQLDAALEGLAKLGKEKSRSVSSEDVTEYYLDLETRLGSARELRDRLRALLARATTVKELVAVETELGRVQAEIESMQGQLDRLKGQVELATIQLQLERRLILGPLGYLAKGIIWAFSKLFVIR
jgi:uncharacterized protein DUF4349